MGLSKARRTGRTGLGRTVLLTPRRAPRRLYLTATAVTAGGLLLLALPVIVLRRRSGPVGLEPEVLEGAGPDPGAT